MLLLDVSVPTLPAEPIGALKTLTDLEAKCPDLRLPPPEVLGFGSSDDGAALEIDWRFRCFESDPSAGVDDC